MSARVAPSIDELTKEIEIANKMAANDLDIQQKKRNSKQIETDEILEPLTTDIVVLPLPPPPLGKRLSTTSAFSLFSTTGEDGGSTTPYLRLVNWLCSMAGILFGYSSSSINDSIPFMRRELNLSPAGVGLITSCFLVGAAFGGIIGGKLADRFGRKRILVLNEVLFVLGTLGTSLAPNFEIVLITRLFHGFSAGGITSVAPVLLAETSTPEQRSQSVTMSLLILVFGELCVFIVGAILGNVWYENDAIWRWINVLIIIPAIFLLVLHIIILPESPRWLAQRGKANLAWKTLRRMRTSSAQTRHELREIDAAIANNTNNKSGENEKTKKAGIGDILTVSWLRTVLLVGIAIAITQQAYGIAIGMLYGTEVLREAGLDTKMALVANIGIGLISFLASWGGLLIVSRVGRRSLLISGQIGTLCSHLLIVICSAILPHGIARGWTTFGLLLPFLVFSQGAISTVTWLMSAEIFPLSMRGIGTGICMLSAWFTACAVSQLFPICVNNFGQAFTFSGFIFFGLILLIFTWLYLPETRNKTLEQLEFQFQHGDWKALKQPGISNAERKLNKKS
ncbi:MFS domain-containing protein [Meloidogyne graminicola]|uniref:MFS domain-containing protein n=1 Tax=Meloidogyne graminicola TaxID=189291 RepID=A0A8S9ZV48_9BILA|nr:MFS domain-containing protein [Meloidogyne graminicola]